MFHFFLLFNLNSFKLLCIIYHVSQHTNVSRHNNYKGLLVNTKFVGTKCKVGSRIDEVQIGYDRNYVLESNKKMKSVAIVYDKKSGRLMNIQATAPSAFHCKLDHRCKRERWICVSASFNIVFGDSRVP